MRKLVRRLAILLCPVFLFLSAGCSASRLQPAAEPVLTFQANADVTMNKSRYVCRLQYSAGGGAQLTVLQPKELSGMTWVWDQKLLSVSYEGLTAPQEGVLLPQSSMIPLLMASLDAAAVSGGLTTSGDGLYFGSGGGHDFTLTADRRSGWIKQLNVPEEGLTVVFETVAE